MAGRGLSIYLLNTQRYPTDIEDKGKWFVGNELQGKELLAEIPTTIGIGRRNEENWLI